MQVLIERDRYPCELRRQGNLLGADSAGENSAEARDLERDNLAWSDRQSGNSVPGADQCRVGLPGGVLHDQEEQ